MGSYGGASGSPKALSLASSYNEFSLGTLPTAGGGGFCIYYCCCCRQFLQVILSEMVAAKIGVPLLQVIH